MEVHEALMRVIRRKKGTAGEVKAAELILAYGLGRPVDVVATMRLGGPGMDENSPEAVLLRMAGFPLPGESECRPLLTDGAPGDD